jgi:undecaprenyl-diphosphatase
MVFYPEYTIEFTFIGLSIASSRIILGMHFLSDVVVGAAVGTLLGYLSLALLS